MTLNVRVMIYKNKKAFEEKHTPYRNYVINHDDAKSRRVLGDQFRNAFEAGQVVVTIPV